ncbi:hypothetical protein MYP_1435 [Sporocytophaga myxococcoides]|uniref:HD domain-containing protein n=2 Tax=Sporocytophaga myxococcoides TaxID=153721 RepID=A0A098LCK2_9BACT|nr:hypothetical protein MYP_1435 [Sporocytophaga myxococcoides]
MVTEALIGLDEFKMLNEQDQHILFASALLHDVEKRSTTVIEDDGRITSKGHAKKGELTARNILYTEVETPFFIREAIAKLVRHHGLPLWVFEKEDPVKAAISASLEVSTMHLSLLAQADILGRVCPDKDELLYKIELFSELCREHDCFGKAKQFRDNISKFFYLQRKESGVDFVPFNDTKFEVIMMAGIPGAGKDTYVKKHFPDLPVVSLDDIRRRLKIDPTDSKGNGTVIQEAKEAAKVYMRARKSFVWNATNITRSMREQLIDLFTSYGGRVKIIYVEVPYKVLLKQNENREYAVPLNVIQKMIQKLEVPSAVEAQEVLYEAGF